MSDLPSVVILVLNWNGAADTLECLQSLESVNYSNMTPIVIDNGSTDDSVSRIRNEFPDIEILELPENLLFAGGNNAGLISIIDRNYDFVMFLNNDTVVEPDFLEPLISAFQENPKVGMAAPLILYHGSDLIWYGGGIVNLWTGRVAHKHIRKSWKEVEVRNEETEYITGCCLLMPTSLAIESGGFNTSFRMYGEDVDLSIRTRKQGKALRFVPQSRIYHKVSSSMGGEFAAGKLMRKAKGLLGICIEHARWYQWPVILISQGLMAFGYLMKFVLYSVKTLRRDAP